MQRQMKRIVLVTAALVALGLGTSSGANDKAIFIQLPTGYNANAVSSSGVVVGSIRPVGAFHWIATSGAVFAGGLGASGVSRDGRTIVGTALDASRNQQAGIWQRGTEWRLLGSVVPNARPCDNLISSGYGTNGDGTVLVGLAWDSCGFARAFRWEESTGMVDLGSTVANRSSRANGVSGDGRVVVGWQEHATGFRQGARWVDGRQTVFTYESNTVGEAAGANTDGSIIVGYYCQPGVPLNQQAWVWTAQTGVQCLDVPRFRPSPVEGVFLGQAITTSDDGRVIGGAHNFGLESESVIWIDRVPHYLKDYLRENGAPNAFDGWVNSGFVTGMSRDGRVLVGFGAGPRDFTGFVVIMPDLGEKP